MCRLIGAAVGQATNPGRIDRPSRNASRRSHSRRRSRRHDAAPRRPRAGAADNRANARCRDRGRHRRPCHPRPTRPISAPGRASDEPQPQPGQRTDPPANDPCHSPRMVEPRPPCHPPRGNADPHRPACESSRAGEGGQPSSRVRPFRPRQGERAQSWQWPRARKFAGWGSREPEIKKRAEPWRRGRSALEQSSAISGPSPGTEPLGPVGSARRSKVRGLGLPRTRNKKASRTLAKRAISPRAEFGHFGSCEGEDSNLHGSYPASTSSWCVCHSATLARGRGPRCQ